MATSTKKIPAKKVAAKKTATTRQPRRTREEGMELLISAAFELVRHNSPDDISIREIASLAKVHHRFIAEWFGGKAQLLLIVHSRNADNIRGLTSTVNSMQTPQVILVITQQIQLSLWLMRNGIEFPDLASAFPSLPEAIHNLEANRGISPKDARVIGSIYGAVLLSNVIVNPFIKDAPTTDELFEYISKVIPPVLPLK
ncbi:MAG: TetR/AcrR family transcriptional regulator [Actinobacteria bacterium]|jgi:AcrR family transcriptional regulator|nr:TetR/AcrR family transcriptional regulator [Actinomycetota bacterium]